VLIRAQLERLCVCLTSVWRRRCGMNASSLTEMKSSILKAVSDFVDVEAEDLVDVSITTDPDMGTIYSVSMPVRRVKPQV
jgi:septum formation topological specificity factor MinE